MVFLDYFTIHDSWKAYGFIEKWVSLNVPTSLPSINNGDVLDGFLSPGDL